MLINSKSKYAVIAMINLAKHSKQAPVSLADLAERQGLSNSYLEQLFSKLKKPGLVASVRGPGGGYELPSVDVSVAQIVEAINGRQPTSAKGWGFVVKKVGDELKEIKLRDLLL